MDTKLKNYIKVRNAMHSGIYINNMFLAPQRDGGNKIVYYRVIHLCSAMTFVHILMFIVAVITLSAL